MGDDKQVPQTNGKRRTAGVSDATITASGIGTNDDTLAPGQLFAGRFEVGALLGAGGMGQVWQARDCELDELVALKLLHPRLVADPRIAVMFRREVKAARRITSPYVARTFEFGICEQVPYLVMELIDGTTLAERLHQGPPLSVSAVVALALDVCSGLAAAHDANVIHRDVKPANVMLRASGRAVLTDFGIARLALNQARETGAPSGTPAYMAPEQVRGGDITPATDVFALGTMLYELFAGLLPWDAKSGYELALARVIHPPRPISSLAAHLPAYLADIVMRCIEREPAARFASARALRDALSLATGEHAVTELASVAVASLPVPQIARLPRLAVLPFQGRGGEDAELEKGLAEDLALALASQRGLHVLSQRAVTPLLDRDLDAIDLCRELDAMYLVEGSVRRTGINYRIGIRLLSREAGNTIWTGRFDRAPGALLEVGDEAAAAILGVLGLTAKVQQSVIATRDPRAIELYLRARPAIRSLRVELLDQAVGWLDEARVLSPNDPTIDAALALALCRRWMMQVTPVAEDLARAGTLANGAIARGTDHGEAHFARALVQLNCGEPIVAARALRRAIAHAPSLGEAHEQLGILLLEAGHIAGGQQRLQVAAALDPTLIAPAWSGALQLAYSGDWAAHDAAFAAANVGDGDNGLRWWWLARMALWRNDPDHAAMLYTELLGAADISEHPVVAWAKVTLDAVRLRNRAVDSLAILDAWAAGPQTGTRRAMGIATLRAEVMAFSGDWVDALGAVGSAVEFGLFDTPWLLRCPLLAPLRTHPEWGRLAAKVEARAAEVLDALRGDGSQPGQ